MACLARQNLVPLLLPRQLGELRLYTESLLLAECRMPTPYHVAMHIHNFSQLLELAQTGKPFLYRKRHTLSLLFNVSALQSEMRIDCPDDLVVGYTQSMMGFLLFNPAPHSIGMIGLGGGSLAKFCYRYLTRSSIAVAEICPEVIALRDQFRIPKDDERLQIHCIDGSEFIERTVRQFDVLMIDGFDKDGQPPQLCSQRFYDNCYRALTPNGILVVNILGDEPETLLLAARIHRAFNGASIVVDALDSLNKVVFACKGTELDLPEHVLMGRIGILDALHPMVMREIVEGVVRHRSAPGWLVPPSLQAEQAA
jgi:spermidine synthase